MFRLSFCQLCSLNRYISTRTPKRFIFTTKIQWRKPAAAASLPKISEAQVDKTIINNVSQSGPQSSGKSRSQTKRSPRTSDVVNCGKNIIQVSTTAPTSFEPLKSTNSPANSEVSPTKNVQPLRLVNAVDPSLLDKSIKLELGDLPGYYLGLSKFRLTGLVVVTAMAGYALAPATFLFGPFFCLSVGTALTSAAANTINQIIEVPYDSQMDRTKNRVLVRGRLSREHAAAFAVVSGVGGLAILHFGANGLTAALGCLNLLLYTCVYTPLKRHSIVNTWVGSVVGGIPPVMGWAACTGELSHGALLLGGILYAWQFPHFNALSWNLKNDYGKAGYKMMAVTHPELCKKTALRYSFSLILMSSLAPVCNVTSWTFALDSLPLNGYLAYLAYRFYQDGDSSSSRKLFRFSLIHLPALIMLMMISKQNWRKEKACSSDGNNKSIVKQTEIENQQIVDPVLASLGESIIAFTNNNTEVNNNSSSNYIEPAVTIQR